jgi:hypothetical protein
MRNFFPSRQWVYYGRGSAKVGSSETLPVAMSRPFTRFFVTIGDIPSALTLPLRDLQQATDAFMPDYFPSRQWVYYGRGSAKVGSSEILPVAMSRPFTRFFVTTGDIPTTLTLPLRDLQQATDAFMRNFFPGRQWVYYGRGSAKVGSSETLPVAMSRPFTRFFVTTGDIPSYHFDPASSSSAASHRPFHAQPLSGQAVGIVRKRLR